MVLGALRALEAFAALEEGARLIVETIAQCSPEQAPSVSAFVRNSAPGPNSPSEKSDQNGLAATARIRSVTRDA